jgi:hypothetical protein
MPRQVKGAEEFAGRSNSRSVINRRKIQELNQTVMHEKGIKTIMTPLLTLDMLKHASHLGLVNFRQ